VLAGTHFAPEFAFRNFRNFLFGKIGAVYAGVAFRNAPLVSKRNHVEITTLGVDNTYRSRRPAGVVERLCHTLLQCAHCRRLDLRMPSLRLRKKTRTSVIDWLHTFHSNIWQESATGLLSLNPEFRNVCSFWQTQPKSA